VNPLVVDGQRAHRKTDLSSLQFGTPAQNGSPTSRMILLECYYSDPPWLCSSQRLEIEPCLINPGSESDRFEGAFLTDKPLDRLKLRRRPDNEAIFARLISTLARRDRLKALDRDAVALLLEHAARLADHAGKLSLVVEQVRDVAIEADYCARKTKRSAISRADVDEALNARIRRAARLRDRAQEAILERVALIDTTGAHVGQVNGLSVTELGGFVFGRPTRITCQVRPGTGKLSTSNVKSSLAVRFTRKAS
jgi:LonB protease-like protein